MANPNPSPGTRFQPGQSGNPGGMTAEQRAIIKENADKALRIQSMLLDGVMAKLEKLGVEQREGILRSDINKIIGDAVDRELGKSISKVDLSSEDGSMSPQAHGDAVLEALKAKRNKGD
jgi:hypothetical protein